MDVGQFRPGDRQAFRCRIEAYGARPERDHSSGRVPNPCPTDVEYSAHFGFRAVHVKDRNARDSAKCRPIGSGMTVLRADP